MALTQEDAWRSRDAEAIATLTEVVCKPFDDNPAPESSWSPVELGPILRGIEAGEIVGPIPEFGTRTDGVALFYPREIHGLHGEPERCKGWIAKKTICDVIERGENVLYMDFEDAPANIVMRLLALGLTAEQILRHFTYVRPTDPFQGHLPEGQFALAVIDGVSEAYALLGLGINSNDDAATFPKTIPRPLADRGAAVVLIDHVTRDRDQRGRYAIGAQHKLAGVAAAYSTEVVDEPSRTSPGLVKLKISKDRHGHVRSHASGKTIALVRITPEDEGDRVTVTLEPPDAGEPDEEFAPTRLMQKTSIAVEKQPGISSTDLRETVKGKNDFKASALRLLIDQEYIEARKDGRTVRHYSLKPYREGDS